MSVFSSELPLLAVVIFILHGDEVLLARKRRKVGKGLYNGYGGKIEGGESALECALRELPKESGIVLDARDLEEVGLLECVTYHDAQGQSVASRMKVTLFLARLPSKPRARPSDEMGEPRWFPIAALPYAEMIPADRDWLPHLFAGRKMYACVHVGPGQRTRIRDTDISLR